MRTALINPPAGGARFIREGRCMQSVDSWAAIWPPLTLAILAAVARDHGPVDLLDCNVDDDDDLPAVLRRLTAFAPDVVVVNASFPSFDHDAVAAAAVKEALPGALTLLFGVVPTLLDEEALRAGPGWDVAIRGEPEATFREVLERRSEGRSLDGTAGLLWRDGDDIRKGPDRPLIEDLDVIPHPARDLLRNDSYLLPNNGRPFTLVNAARGCPYRCSFCIATVYYGRRSRRHSLEYVLDEIEQCVRSHGIRDFLMWEEIFTLDQDFGHAFCRALVDRKLDISWAATTRCDAVEPSMLAAMKKAGCFMLGLGVESGAQEILDAAGKGEKVEEASRAAALCREAGIMTMGHFIFGLPGETKDTIRRTIDFALGLGLDYLQCYVAVPYPKTSLGEEARTRGWITASQWTQYDFGGTSIMKTATMDPATLDAARAELFRRFYFRPGYLLRQARRLLAHPRQILQASRFLNWIWGRK